MQFIQNTLSQRNCKSQEPRAPRSSSTSNIKESNKQNLSPSLYLSYPFHSQSQAPLKSS